MKDPEDRTLEVRREIGHDQTLAKESAAVRQRGLDTDQGNEERQRQSGWANEFRSA
jgi:hypothetical protein